MEHAIVPVDVARDLLTRRCNDAETALAFSRYPPTVALAISAVRDTLSALFGGTQEQRAADGFSDRAELAARVGQFEEARQHYAAAVPHLKFLGRSGGAFGGS